MPFFSDHGVRARSEPGGTRWRTGGEVKGELANGVGSQYNSNLPRNVVCPALLKLMCTPRLPAVDWTDAPTDLNGLRPFRGKTKSGFCACAITFRTSYTMTGVGWGALHYEPEGRGLEGSIPDGVIGIFLWRNLSGRTMVVGLTQPLREMSTRNIYCGVKAAGA